MGCSASKQAPHFEAAPPLPEKPGSFPSPAARTATPVPPHAADSSSAPANGTEDNQPKFGEVIHESYTRCELPMNGMIYKLDLHKYSYPHQRPLSEAEKKEGDAEDLQKFGPAPGPPRMIGADEARALQFCNSNPFNDVSHDIVSMAFMWGPPNADALFLRLTATDKGVVSADAAFVVNGHIVMPHEVHNAVEKQKELFKEMLGPWMDMVEGRITGIDHPGDIVLLYKRDCAISLDGIDWMPDAYLGSRRRELWLPALKDYCNTQRALQRFKQRLADEDEAVVKQKTATFVKRLQPAVASIITESLTWPPITRDVRHFGITLVHMRGRRPSARVVLRDAANNDITSMDTDSFPDPTLLQDAAAKHWIDLCATGVPGVDHAPYVTISAPVSGGEIQRAPESICPPAHRRARATASGEVI